MAQNLLVLVTGNAATGKSTLGKKISQELNIPLVSPDAIKEIMWDGIGWEHDVEGWHKFGRTSFELMYYFIHVALSKGKSIVAEAHFDPEVSNERLDEITKEYGCKLLQIYCSADKSVIADRFRQRLKSENYHKGHKHGIRKIYSEEEFFSRIGTRNLKLKIEGKTLEIDTTDPEKIDHAKIFEFIKNN